MSDKKKYYYRAEDLPENFPTHRHEPLFWEYLGRTVATFGFLEEVLGKAIFSFTAMTPYSDLEIDEAYKKWLQKLERALIDPLYNLAEVYGKSVRDNPEANIENIDHLLGQLKEAANIRNVLCHGSWMEPNSRGASVPLFVRYRDKAIFETEVDCAYLKQVQKHVTELICLVMSSVTQMGWQFPGRKGPGAAIV
jgi:hypothetical protein